MRPRPYIGITGFMTPREIDEVLSVLPTSSSQLVMIGILASTKSLNNLPNKWPKRYPHMSAVPGLFVPSENRLNLFHFNTDHRDRFASEMIELTRVARHRCDGFQLNMAWPDPWHLGIYRSTSIFKDRPVRTKIVLQCGSKALQMVDNDPKKLAAKVREYEGLIDYVLVDPSGGLGQEFDLEFAFDCFDELQKIDWIGFGIAGGLHPNNLHRIVSLLHEFPEFSIDAEGRLRDSANNLDIETTKAYLRIAEHLYRLSGPYVRS